ncbi:MAG: response regulator transcription factor [Muribaculaceae bacterium]|nr:response regulator transcription factor [Roseburia sp.]MCM1432168.1 response regulator transcription factor [Muribaculaceae bacterium]MCM1492146.1 response regulator transcription factor [Muribaculaceae bacterium]
MDHNTRVLFLEDEPTIREVLTEYMKMSGYEVTETANGDDAIAALQETDYDIAVLDIMVPGPDGFAVLEYIQTHFPQTAVLMLTALDDEKTQIKAFNLYADDYIIKPVSPIILLKRMESVLRRTARTREAPAAVKAQGLYLEEDSYSAYYAGEKLPLTLTEYLLLQTLYKNPHRVYTREQLILNIFNEEYVGNDRIIDAHIKNLRKKLPISCIKTIIGVGYQFEEAFQKEAVK